jgi:hypothetical protein
MSDRPERQAILSALQHQLKAEKRALKRLLQERAYLEWFDESLHYLHRREVSIEKAEK